MSDNSDAQRTPGPPLLNEPAPDFQARTTMGDRSLSSYRGKWVLLFSHPADFTPVCTSELIGFARCADRFRELNCELLGLSVDSLFAHIAWVRSVRERFGVEVTFPVVEDSSGIIARAYGMIHPRASDASTVRGVFVIDPHGITRAIVWYPLTVGRNVEELVRLVAALQMAETNHVSTPEGWKIGDDVLIPPPVTLQESDTDSSGKDWYFRTERVQQGRTKSRSKSRPKDR
jgi:peroxiredoxin (alkyl hydroperoxide reductase subunit C)